MAYNSTNEILKFINLSTINESTNKIFKIIKFIKTLRHLFTSFFFSPGGAWRPEAGGLGGRRVAAVARGEFGNGDGRAFHRQLRRFGTCPTWTPDGPRGDARSS